jgi:hypothetical protein
MADQLTDQRSARRHSVFVTRTTVRRLGATAIEATLSDLSIYGCRIACDEQPAGERVYLRLPGGVPVAATIIWSENGLTGCRFDTPIARATVRALTLT